MNNKKTHIVKIIQSGNPILREDSEEVKITDIKSAKIKKIVADLKEVLAKQKDAAAIAAVQIGHPVRLFIIAKRAFEMEGGTDTVKDHKDLVFINPKIIKSSKMKQDLEEGCLSVRYIYGKVERPEKTTIEAYDENGKKFSRGFSGILSQIVQHENDHLNGILFTDKATELIELTKEEYESNIAKL